MSARIVGQNVMVTGGCGFIGAHLVHRLATENAARIVVVDSLRHGQPTSLTGVDVELVRHELGTGAVGDLERAMKGVDVLFHLAAEKHNQAGDDPLRIYRANIEGTHTLFDVARRSGVRKIVFASSLYAYGRDRGPAFVESEVARPRTPYGISKLAGEHMLGILRAESAGAAVSLRYMFVYGPPRGAGTRSLITTSFARIAAGQPPIVRGDGAQVFDYVFVDDVIDATLLAMQSDVDGEIINVGSGKGTTVAEIVRHISNIAPCSLTPTHAPADATSGSSRVANIEKAGRLLGWIPHTSLEDGLRITFERGHFTI